MAALRYVVSPSWFADWDGLYALLMDCFAYMETRIDPPSSLLRMTPETLRQKAEDEALVVVFDGDALIGCGFLAEREDYVYLGKLAVAPAHRGLGILREIVAIAEQLARAGQRSALQLETRIELVENHQAFAALGFVKSAENSHAGFERPTSIEMTKPLR